MAIAFGENISGSANKSKQDRKYCKDIYYLFSSCYQILHIVVQFLVMTNNFGYNVQLHRKFMYFSKKRNCTGLFESCVLNSNPNFLFCIRAKVLIYSL